MVTFSVKECTPLSHLVTDRCDVCGKLLGHISRSSTQEDHHRAIAAVIRKLFPDWKRPLRRRDFMQWRQT